MKKNDIAIIILVVSASLVVSYFLIKTILGSPSESVARVEKVEPISAEIVEPSEKIFNEDAINPTVVIQIGKPSNQQPFDR